VRVSWRRLLWLFEPGWWKSTLCRRLLQCKRRFEDLESDFSFLILLAMAFMNRIVNVFGTIDHCLLGSLYSQQQPPASAWIR
jgi:hypothetical protein